MNVAEYERYYKAKLEGALLYQDFVVDCAWNLLGLAIVQYASKTYQQSVGESRTGVEIKHDEQFAKTGNLWIEVAEKARPREGDYATSGIYRQDNAWLYVIGDYDTLFFFSKRLLVALHKSGKFNVIENRTKTSRGFLLSHVEGERYASILLHPKAAQKIAKIAADIEHLGRELHALVRRDERQLSLFEAVERRS